MNMLKYTTNIYILHNQKLCAFSSASFVLLFVSHHAWEKGSVCFIRS